MMDLEFNIDIDEANDFSNLNEGIFWSGRDGTIFVIDTSSKMLSTNSDEEIPFTKALRCVHSAISRKIIGNSQDLYAVILFNTSNAKNDLDFPNIFVLQEFDRPGAEKMLHLENLLGEDNLIDILKCKFGSSNSVNMHEVFWICRNIFIKSKFNLSSKNVMIFTCEDDPHGSDGHKKKQAIKSAKDLKEIGTELEILSLQSTFDANKFYKHILIDEDDKEVGNLSALVNSSDRLDELLDRVRRIEHRQRSSGKALFTIGKGLEMGVKVYSTFRKIVKSQVKLYKGTNEEVISQRKEFLEETGELIMPSDFQKYQEFGLKRLKFTVDEVKFISSVYEPGIELLGFKSKHVFKPFLYIKPANFIYPDESFVKGSSVFFSCLLDRCLVKDVYPVVRIITRQGSSVSWAYLLPQKEVTDEAGYQIKPPGFHVCYLPFADDFRLVDLGNKARASHDQVDGAKNVLKKLHFKYAPENFENPEIQTHWRNIETLALNRLQLEEIVDFTVPNYKGIAKKADGLINEFKSLVLPPEYNPNQLPKKRPISAPESKAKRVKDDQPVNIEEMAKKREIHKLKVDELKEWLTKRGVKTAGKKKAQLIEDVYDEL